MPVGVIVRLMFVCVFDLSVPPGNRLVTLLAFETASDANALTLRVRLGYGEVELPR